MFDTLEEDKIITLLSRRKKHIQKESKLVKEGNSSKKRVEKIERIGLKKMFNKSLFITVRIQA